VAEIGGTIGEEQEALEFWRAAPIFANVKL
jgi:hypothetical protein